MEPELSNEKLLGILRQRLAEQSLLPESVRSVLTEVDAPEAKTSVSFSFIKLLYIVGGVIVSLGILFFVGQIWSDIGSLGRILITFGLGLGLAMYGTHFMRTQPATHLGDVLHAIAGLLLPGGALVVLAELGNGIDSAWSVIAVFTAVAALYLLLLRVVTGSVLVFYAIGNSTIAITLLFAELFPLVDEQVYLLYYMVVGVVYVYLAYAFAADWNRYLTVFLSVVGSTTFYVAAFSSLFIGPLFWELLFPGLALGGMALATKTQSRILLLVTTVSLIAYIVYLTNEYFADSIGWPLSLVLLGFVIIGIGFSSIRLGKTYV
jgi:hypothetical protein